MGPTHGPNLPDSGSVKDWKLGSAFVVRYGTGMAANGVWIVQNNENNYNYTYFLYTDNK